MREYGMSKEEFKCVAKAYPAFATQVKFWTEIIAIRGDDKYAEGVLEGYCRAMIDIKQVVKARVFVGISQEIANRKYRKEGTRNDKR